MNKSRMEKLFEINEAFLQHTSDIVNDSKEK